MLSSLVATKNSSTTSLVKTVSNPLSRSNDTTVSGGSGGGSSILHNKQQQQQQRRRKQQQGPSSRKLADYVYMLFLFILLCYMVIAGMALKHSLVLQEAQPLSSSSSSSSSEQQQQQQAQLLRGNPLQVVDQQHKQQEMPLLSEGKKEEAPKVDALEKPVIARHVAQEENVKDKVLAKPMSVNTNANTTRETLVLTTTEGLIQIVLRPDLSADSVRYIRRLVELQKQQQQQKQPDSPTTTVVCKPCNFYRAENPGILQGILKSKLVPGPTERGTCPAGMEKVKNDCPEWDAHCGCHGPVMKRGYVAWAAGATGPDFFIDSYREKATWWGTQHTVFGIIEEADSLATVDRILNLPVKEEDGLSYLLQPLHFDIRMLETASTVSV